MSFAESLPCSGSPCCSAPLSSALLARATRMSVRTATRAALLRGVRRNDRVRFHASQPTLSLAPRRGGLERARDRDRGCLDACGRHVRKRFAPADTDVADHIVATGIDLPAQVIAAEMFR